jgi:hypothetical protein
MARRGWAATPPASFGLASGWGWGAYGAYIQRQFVANLSYFLGIVGRFMPAALDGAVGMLQGAECRVWAVNL